MEEKGAEEAEGMAKRRIIMKRREGEERTGREGERRRGREREREREKGEEVGQHIGAVNLTVQTTNFDWFECS